ncbi:MAG: O-antigen ligase family protein [Candidatus Omnitrophica bacterium]|nr:O-antigen ligase family protein [Candidatus Omnitrophota bacterium]
MSSQELLGIIPIVAILIALVITKSLGAWLSLIFTFIILTITLYNKFSKKRWLIFIACIFIFLVLIFILSNRWERLINLKNPQNSITQRLNYWNTAIAIIKDHPFLGVGPGNFQKVFLKYKIGLSTDTRYAHNIFLHQWAETGILGFFGIFYLVFNLFRMARIKAVEKFIHLSIFVFFLHNLIDNAYFIPETGILWWVLLGFVFTHPEHN